jgi:AAHS family 4-hydroxybenzoate transporter-like MFS transporter
MGQVLLCGIALFVCGLALQSLSITLPWLEREGAIGPSSAGPLLAAAMGGLMIGYIVLAPLADTIGRRALVTGGSMVLSLSLAASALGGSIEALFAARVSTGLAIGAITPTALSSLGQTGSERWRASRIITAYTAYPLGFSASAATGAWLIPRFGWQSLFAASAILALLLSSLLWLVLPRGETPAQPLRDGATAAQLLGEQRVTTLVLWLVFIVGLGLFYGLQGWLPILAQQSGATIDAALSATAMFGVGAACAMVPIATLSRFISLLPLLIASLMLAMLGVAALAFALRTGVLSLPLASFAAGLGVGGVQKAGVAAATLLYPARLRSTGLAWALGVGRLGAALGPLLVGALLVQLHPSWAILALTLPVVPLVLIIGALDGRSGSNTPFQREQALPVSE